MAEINYSPELEDDYSAEVIRLARERSPSIDAWFVEQRYLCETSEDNLSALWLRNRVVIKICEELAESGIRIQKDPDVVCDEPQLVYTVLMLRQKFDSDRLFELFRDHVELVEEIRSDLGSETLINIIAWCHEHLPMDEGWELLSDTLDQQPGIFDGEDPKFLQVINLVLEKLDLLGEPDDTKYLDQDLIVKYIQFLSKRADYIRQVAYSLWVNFAKTEFEKTSRQRIIDSIVDGGFERQLGTRACMERVLPEFEKLDLHDHNQIASFLAIARKPYKKLWNTCLDFYVGEEHKKCPDSILVMILSTLIIDAWNPLSVPSCVISQLKTYEEFLGTEAIRAIQERFETMMANFISPVEVNYAAD